MSILQLISDKINNITKYITFIMLAIMTATISLQVFYRYILGSSLTWSEEIARYLFIWVIMLGASIGIKERFHISITIIKDKLSGKAKQILDIILNLGIGILGVIMVTSGAELAQVVAIQLSPAMRLNMSLVYMSVPVSGILIVIHVLDILQTDVKSLISKDYS